MSSTWATHTPIGAATYDEPNPLIVAEESALVQILTGFPPGFAVDVAAGTGRLAGGLGGLGHTVVAKSALKALFLQFEAEGDPRRNTKLLVRDRWTGEVAYTQEWLHDPNGAVVAKGMIESDLERLGIKDFLGEYSIYWTPPHAGGDPDARSEPPQ